MPNISNYLFLLNILTKVQLSFFVYLLSSLFMKEINLSIERQFNFYVDIQFNIFIEL